MQSCIANEDYEDLRFSFRMKRSARKRFQKKNKKATILSWLIDVGVIQEDEEILAVDEMSKRRIKKGIIKREGILCLCCNKMFIVENIHVHGGSFCIKPYESILVSQTNISLFSYMVEAWNNHEESEYHKFNLIESKDNSSDSHDDACMICADGGNLICCEACSSTYHQGCISMEDVPEDSWFCPYCLCIFCAKPALENEQLLPCPQCAKKFHWECHQKKERQELDLNSFPVAPFCERSCKEVSDKLRKGMVGIRNELDEGYFWTILHRMDDKHSHDEYLTTTCNSKLVVARRLMEESFEPIEDRHTRIKIIPSVIYSCGANFNRMNFEGFYTAVLEKADEIISVAALRIHGTKFAEMPFIATSEAYRCMGMCKKLMVAIESALGNLNVENLIIPSVPERIDSWIQRYGFCHLKKSMEQEIIAHNTLMFHDSVRLQKIILSTPS